MEKHKNQKPSLSDTAGTVRCGKKKDRTDAEGTKKGSPDNINESKHPEKLNK